MPQTLQAEGTPQRSTFRHGDLRRALVEAGLAMARRDGSGAVVLREATRQAGVVPNAAYRHFANQAELLTAVRLACVRELAESMEAQLARVRPGSDAAAFARRSLRAVGMGYLQFAQTQPGLFRTAFGPGSPVLEGAPTMANTGATGLNPFQLLSLALDRMATAGILSAKDRRGAEFLAWSAVHGMAWMLLDGPLKHADESAQRRLADRLLSMVEQGLA